MTAYDYKFAHGKSGTIITDESLEDARKDIIRNFPHYELIELKEKTEGKKNDRR